MASRIEQRAQAIRDGDRKQQLAALRGNNGYLAGVAAGELDGSDEVLVGAAIEAFERLCVDGAKRDPQCMGKLAIATALRDAEVQAPSVYLAGVRHVQKEPVYGGSVDTAGQLRGICGMALVESHHPRAMAHVGELLADPEPAARIAAARACRNCGRDDIAEPLLRFGLRAGEEHPEVLAETLGALLELAPEPGLQTLGELLAGSDAILAEASALALGESRRPEALALLVTAAETETLRRRVLFTAIALLRSDAAWQHLVEVVMDAALPTARLALEALATFAHDSELRRRCRDAVDARGEDELTEAFLAAFDDAP